MVGVDSAIPIQATHHCDLNSSQQATLTHQHDSHDRQQQKRQQRAEGMQPVPLTFS